MRFFFKLLWSHADAWGVALMITAGAVMLHGAWSGQAAAILIATAVATLIGFAVNDLFDVSHDQLDPRKRERNPFIGLSRATARGLIFAASAILLTAPSLAAAVFGVRGLGVLIAGGLAAWAYSAPPIRLKSRPLLDLITHALFVETFPYAITLFLLKLPFTDTDRAALALLLMASLAAQLEQQARDYETDRSSDRNFTTRWGVRVTVRLLRIVTALLIGVSALAFLVGWLPLPLAPYGAVMIPVLLARFLRRANQPRSEKLIRVVLGASLAYTVLLIAMTLVEQIAR